MILTNLFTISAIIAISRHCLVDGSSSLRPFLNKPYKLVSTDENFDKVLKHLGIGWIKRNVFELAKPKLTLTWNPITNIYTITEQNLFAKIEAPFQVVTIILTPISFISCKPIEILRVYSVDLKVLIQFTIIDLSGIPP